MHLLHLGWITATRVSMACRRIRLKSFNVFRTVLCCSSSGRRYDHITPALRDLHWLPVEQQIIFKILLFTFKALNGLAPSYLSHLVKFYVPQRHLRSSSQKLLAVPFSKTKSYGDRAFSSCAPKL